MPSKPLAYVAPDIGALARHLARAHAARTPDEPAWNHSRWLNALAHAADAPNYQAWLARAQRDLAAPASDAAPRDAPHAELPTSPRTAAEAPALTVEPPAGAGRTWRASSAATVRDPLVAAIAQAAPGLAEPDRHRVLRSASHFDGRGRLLRWPSKRSLADLCLWALWMRLAAERHYSEGEITAILAGLHAFGDPVTLRRELINARLIARTDDGRDYWREAKQPDAAGEALMAAVRFKMGQ